MGRKWSRCGSGQERKHSSATGRGLVDQIPAQLTANFLERLWWLAFGLALRYELSNLLLGGLLDILHDSSPEQTKSVARLSIAVHPTSTSLLTEVDDAMEFPSARFKRSNAHASHIAISPAIAPAGFLPEERLKPGMPHRASDRNCSIVFDFETVMSDVLLTTGNRRCTHFSCSADSCCLSQRLWNQSTVIRVR
jgi:hypothetical protein